MTRSRVASSRNHELLGIYASLRMSVLEKMRFLEQEVPSAALLVGQELLAPLFCVVKLLQQRVQLRI